LSSEERILDDEVDGFWKSYGYMGFGILN
jgi:hypothetical protein